MRWFRQQPAPTPAPAPRTSTVAALTPRVLMIVHDPRIPSERGRRLHEVFGWHDPDALAQQYIADLATVSAGTLRYQIVERIDADFFPPKLDGFAYGADEFVTRWRAGRQMHQPDALDYPARIAHFDLIRRYERGDFDEVWVFSFPYAGEYESTMIGDSAFWCNSPPVGVARCGRGRFVMMGFNYERDVGCMLENFGHRTESIMERVYQGVPPAHNLWQQFIQYDRIAPGRAACGNVHFAPNSSADYDWGNRRQVLSTCDVWLDFPRIDQPARLVDCRDWGAGDMRLHHLWWFARLPHAAGTARGINNDWWPYIVDPNTVPA